jgi:drug/metabolite transporter (DMT)-like permease
MRQEVGMSRRGWVLFVAMGVIWGVPYLLIKVAVDEISPSLLVLGRTALAAALLLPIAAARGHLRGLRPAWLPLLAFAVIEIAGPWLLLGVAEQQLSSSLTGLLLAAVPLVAAVLAWSGAVPNRSDEKPDLRRVVGLLVGLAGVAALVGFEVGSGDLGAVVAVGGVAICYAVGPVILARWLSHLPGLGVISVSLLVTALIYLPLGVATAPSAWPSATVVWSVVGLAVVCTALAFVVFFELISEVGPSRATVITYLNPAVALVLGVLVLDEAFTVATAAGFALILLGSVLATQRSTAPVGPAAPGDEVVGGERVPAGRWSAVDSECQQVASPVAEP